MRDRWLAHFLWWVGVIVGAYGIYTGDPFYFGLGLIGGLTSLSHLRWLAKVKGEKE